MRVSLRRMGNSHGVVLPRPVLAQLGLEPGGEVDLSVHDGRITLVALPRQRHPREGWAEASKAIAESEDDGIDDDWVDFDDPAEP